MAESKGEGKEADDDPKSSRFDDNELLMVVAGAAEKKLYAADSELSTFVREHASEWESAVEGERDGSGSPIKLMGKWRSLHNEYLNIMESWLTHIVESSGGTLAEFMEDARKAMEGGSGFLFEDDNYAEFVEGINAMSDFEAFHLMMMKHSLRSHK
mmetsp:Transcript_15542/g.31925  ORF Transcript_15542/g.31925 Transcript_15542/m.31925 type:complete len:156 (-) Transcript_15542:225-692(-)|eukprot:CAMPEP_0171638964 /NCGR_PEP_ID=MMETSP0990-20121206/29359_1 /TAXON_ID=483369 /ORGANISM="non described non described, Strain CCMP2098" /LENGTH=155 /DNA_ID=CAMNT_0012212467 /DNA_START=121 /DNA_END=588 /DNA_ORIENTATION=-